MWWNLVFAELIFVYIFSSSHSSPPSIEALARISEHENLRISPTDSTSSLNHQMKIESAPLRSDPHLNAAHAPNSTEKGNFNVPIFALHAKGSYYIPLTLDYKTLVPFLQDYDILEVVPGVHNVVLHPVTINVNFHHPSFSPGKYQHEFSNWH